MILKQNLLLLGFLVVGFPGIITANPQDSKGKNTEGTSRQMMVMMPMMMAATPASAPAAPQPAIPDAPLPSSTEIPNLEDLSYSLRDNLENYDLPPVIEDELNGLGFNDFGIQIFTRRVIRMMIRITQYTFESMIFITTDSFSRAVAMMMTMGVQMMRVIMLTVVTITTGIPIDGVPITGVAGG